MNFVPCSVKHKSCSPAHAAMVRAYREERERQETENDGVWNAYDTEEHRIWKENGNRLITFKDWLMANKKSAYQRQDEIENDRSYFHGGKRRIENQRRTNCSTADSKAAEIQDNSKSDCVRFGNYYCGDYGHAAGIPEFPRGYEQLPRQAI